jgi:isoleucyl-tRNA synthetase
MTKTTQKNLPFMPVDSSKKLSAVEEDVLKFWNDNDIFHKSIENRKTEATFSGSDEDNSYSFYDGPPFATGLPHYGHIVGSVIKDIVPRYWTMKGKYIPRKWGWDCHGLPIENIIEKEMGSKTKKEIEELGVEKFNNLCRSKVMDYADEWKKIITRLGRWADMDNPYKTMDKDFMESVWWTFKQLWDKDLIYYSYRSMHVCPRCETTLSQSEVSEGYQDVKDLSVIAKFEVVQSPISSTTSPRKAVGDVGSSSLQINNAQAFAGQESTNDADERSDGTSEAMEQGDSRSNEVTADKTFILAWTTTPWTLPGNVALAVGKDIDYVK